MNRTDNRLFVMEFMLDIAKKLLIKAARSSSSMTNGVCYSLPKGGTHMVIRL